MAKKGSKNRGESSSGAVGARKRKQWAEGVAESRARKRRAAGEDPREYPETPAEKRAFELLTSMKRVVNDSTLIVAKAIVQSGDMADRLYAQVGDLHGETAARMCTAYATLLKVRRQLLVDLELPGDEIEDENPRPPQRSTPSPAIDPNDPADELEKYE